MANKKLLMLLLWCWCVWGPVWVQVLRSTRVKLVTYLTSKCLKTPEIHRDFHVSWRPHLVKKSTPNYCQTHIYIYIDLPQGPPKQTHRFQPSLCQVSWRCGTSTDAFVLLGKFIITGCVHRSPQYKHNTTSSIWICFKLTEEGQMKTPT